MGWNIQPFEQFEMRRIDQYHNPPHEPLDGLSDGVVSNDQRTQAFAVFARPFTLIYKDPGLAGTFLKVQVNNQRFIDPNSKYSRATPLDYGRDTIYDKMYAAGVAGRIEPSNIDTDFANGWIDYPNQTITSGADNFVGGAGWRWIRVVGVTDAGGLTLAPLNPELIIYPYHGGADHTGK